MEKPQILSEDHQVYQWEWRRKISYIILSFGSQRCISFPHYLSSCLLKIHSQKVLHSRIPFRESENDIAWITSTRTTINIIPDWKAVWASAPPLKQYSLPEQLWPEVKVKDTLTERVEPCQKRLERKSFVSPHPNLVRICYLLRERQTKRMPNASEHTHAICQNCIQIKTWRPTDDYRHAFYQLQSLSSTLSKFQIKQYKKLKQELRELPFRNVMFVRVFEGN